MVDDPIRFDIKKREKTVKDLPTKLIRKFIIIENRDSRGRVSFHLAFKKSRRSRPTTTPIPKKYRVFESLIEAELAIFEMVDKYLKKGPIKEVKFIGDMTFIQKIKHLYRTFRGNKLDK